MIEYTYAPDRFSHAAAACTFRGGVLTAMYSGRQECHSSQRVYLYLSGKGEMKGPIPLEPLTGNPILFTNKGIANIIYSKFEEFPAHKAHWWQHCTLWQRQIEDHNGILKLSEPKQLIVDEDESNPAPGRGYLPRCNPIWINTPATSDTFAGSWYLPLYREQEPHFYGVIMKSADGVTWEHFGNIGKGGTRCIQPTLWYQGGYIHALLRNFNFGFRKRRLAYYSKALLSDGKWSMPIVNGNIYNANNSLVVVDEGQETKEPLFVWNNDPRGRNDISLGVMGPTRIVAKLDDYGSYPAVCTDWDDLHVLYTAKADPLKHPGKATVIKHKVYNIQAIRTTLGNR